jgi:hypothetical protein
MSAPTTLVLKPASASRSSGQWRDDDYDVLENGVVVRGPRVVLLLAGGGLWEMFRVVALKKSRASANWFRR